MAMTSEQVTNEVNSEVQGLNGNALSIYWFMFREKKPYSAREIQRRVRLSSPSLALHHLNKLIEMGLVKTDTSGAYLLARQTKTGLLSLFIGSGRLFIPRMALYAAAMTGFLLSYLLFLTSLLNVPGLILLVGHFLVTVILWLETIKIMRLQPY
jgi:predicted DNA-binding transcriptional regulator